MRRLFSIMMIVALLLASVSLADVLKSGSQGSEVKRAQERLKELGYDTGKPDGIFGKKTAAAVRAFQSENGLEQTGAVDERTNKYLFELSPLAEGQVRLFHAFTGYKRIAHKVNWGKEMDAGVLYHLPVVQDQLQNGRMVLIATLSEGMGMMELYSGSVYTAFGTVEDGKSFFTDFLADCTNKLPDSEKSEVCFIYYDLASLTASYFIPSLEQSAPEQRQYNDIDSFLSAIA